MTARADHLARRHRRERRFRRACAAAVGLALLALGWLLATLLARGVPDIVEHGLGALLLSPDASSAARAGLATAGLGSAALVGLTIALALPLGLVSAIYLEEFAPREGWGARLVRGLTVVINNLASVPAIVFGLLGLALFIGGLGLARSAVLTGALVLALRIVPTVIIGSRSALASVPPTLTDGALSLGASHMQAVFEHKLPSAAPGIFTAGVLSVAQALSEAAPLLLIGMVAFINRPPAALDDPATALPVQIFMWAEAGGPDWSARAAAAALVLLGALLAVNLLAAWARARLRERTMR